MKLYYACMGFECCIVVGDAPFLKNICMSPPCFSACKNKKNGKIFAHVFFIYMKIKKNCY